MAAEQPSERRGRAWFDVARVLLTGLAARNGVEQANALAARLSAPPGPPDPPAVLSGHEFVAHVFVALGGPTAVEDYRYLVHLWRRGAGVFGIDRPMMALPPRPPADLPDLDDRTEVLAAASNPTGGQHQMVLRRVGEVLCLSVLWAPAAAVEWRPLSEAWDALLPAPTPGLLGMVRILQARLATPGALLDPAALQPVVAEHSGLDASRWDDGVLRFPETWGPFAVWEAADGVVGQPARDGRVQRRIAVVAPADRERELSAWTWTYGTGLALFAGYLLAVAVIRFELRVWTAGRLPEARRAARAVSEALQPLLASGQVLTVTESAAESAAELAAELAAATRRLAEAQAAEARLARLARPMRTVRSVVEAAERDRIRYGGDEPPAGLFAEDARMVARLLAEATDELDLLHLTLDRVRDAIGRAGPLVPGWTGRIAETAVRGDPERPDVEEAAWRVYPLLHPRRSTSAERSWLQRVISEAADFQDPVVVAEGLVQTMPRVCRIGGSAGGRRVGGTGFLVAPDLVLTCHHVVDGLFRPSASASAVECVFDYRNRVDGRIERERPVALAPDWLVAHSLLAASDVEPTRREPPGADGLDYVIVRLAKSPGYDVLGHGSRGWLDLSHEPAPLHPGQPLLIMQHPEGKRLAMGWATIVEGSTADGTRLTHRVNTAPGSSGSPCLTADFALVAVHQRGPRPGEPTDRNTAVPITAITRHLIATGHGAILKTPTEHPDD